jgi:hypothetical protein
VQNQTSKEHLSDLLSHPKSKQFIDEVAKYFSRIYQTDPYSPLCVFGTEDVAEIDSVVVYFLKIQNRLLDIDTIVSLIDQNLGLNGSSREDVKMGVVFPSLKRISAIMSRSEKGKKKLKIDKGNGKDINTIKIGIFA